MQPHQHEIKFRERRPQEGQRIAVRFARTTTYQNAVYAAPDHVYLVDASGKRLAFKRVNGATTDAGWLPRGAQ